MAEKPTEQGVEVIGNFVGVCSWRTRGRMTH